MPAVTTCSNFGATTCSDQICSLYSVRLPEADIFWSPACSGCAAGRDRREETIMWLSTVAFSVTLTLGLFLAPDPSHAQSVAKMPRIGILTRAFDPHAPSSLYEVFRQGLRDLGYVEGQSITLEYRSAEGQDERFPALAAELVRLKV